MTKQELINSLNVMRDKFIICYFSIGYIGTIDVDQIGEINMTLQDPITKRSSKINSENIKTILKNKDALKFLNHEAGVSFRKSYINGSFEMIRYYCKLTKQEQLLSQQPWYPFSRVLRNVASHHINELKIDWPRNYDAKGINEVTWKGSTIKKGMKGNQIVYSDLECFELMEEQLTFVSEILN